MNDPSNNWKLRVAGYCGRLPAAEQARFSRTLTIPGDLEDWVEHLADNTPSRDFLGSQLNVVAALVLHRRSVCFWERSDTLWLLQTMAEAARAWLLAPSESNHARACKLAHELGDVPFTPGLGATSEPTIVAALAATATVQEVRDAVETGAYSIYASIAAGRIARIIGEAETRSSLQSGIMGWVESRQS